MLNHSPALARPAEALCAHDSDQRLYRIVSPSHKRQVTENALYPPKELL